MTYDPEHGADFHDSDYYRERESYDNVVPLSPEVLAHRFTEEDWCQAGKHEVVTVKFCRLCGLGHGLEEPVEDWC